VQPEKGRGRYGTGRKDRWLAPDSQRGLVSEKRVNRSLKLGRTGSRRLEGGVEGLGGALFPLFSTFYRIFLPGNKDKESSNRIKKNSRLSDSRPFPLLEAFFLRGRSCDVGGAVFVTKWADGGAEVVHGGGNR